MPEDLMTSAQAKLLRRLCESAGEPFPEDATKNEAHRMIARLKDPVPSRSEVRAVACGTCGAPADEPCREPNGTERGPHHRGRVDRVEWLREVPSEDAGS